MPLDISEGTALSKPGVATAPAQRIKGEKPTAQRKKIVAKRGVLTVEEPIQHRSVAALLQCRRAIELTRPTYTGHSNSKSPRGVAAVMQLPSRRYN